jgi:hypothetical protein
MAMDTVALRVLVKQIKHLVKELEAEIYSDAQSYVSPNKTSTYKVISDNDDDGYPD